MAEEFDIPIGKVVGPQGPQGEPGQSGEDGFSPEVAVVNITGDHRVTITDAEGEHVFDVMDGQDASAATAEDVSYDSSQTYSNGTVGKELTELNQHLTLKQDKTSYVTVSGTSVTQTGADNTVYLCGELTELTFTAPQTGICAVRFTSGTTPTVVTLTGVTMPDDWEGAEASTVYEINIMNGYGLYTSWEVSA